MKLSGPWRADADKVTLKTPPRYGSAAVTCYLNDSRRARPEHHAAYQINAPAAPWPRYRLWRGSGTTEPGDHAPSAQTLSKNDTVLAACRRPADARLITDHTLKERGARRLHPSPPARREGR